MTRRRRPWWASPPNLVTLLRIAGAGVLVALALAGRPREVLALFVLLVLSDWIDGRLARRHGWRTAFGARLDAVADKVLYAGVLFAAWRLEPEAVGREAVWIGVAVGTWLVAAGVEVVRFRRLPGYHTVLAKAAWGLVAVGVVAFLGFDRPGVLRVALVLVTIANLEVVAIALLVPSRRVDVASVVHAWRDRRGAPELPVLDVAATPRAGEDRRGEGGAGPSLTLLQISDLHFGPPYIERVGETLLAEAARLAPDAVVVSGDLTQRARREQFEAARAFLDRLPDVPRIVVPGNHDVPLYRVGERLFHPHRLYREIVFEHLDHAWRLPGAAVVALDSTAPLTAISNGRIHRRQLAAALGFLRDVPEGDARIVVAHHHFAPAPDFRRGETMPEAQRALDVFTRMRVDLILGGHLHRGYIGNSLDVYSGRDRSHGILIVQCGTTTSRRGRAREREKNTFNVVRLEDDRIHVSHHMYFDDLGGWRPLSRHAFPRPHRRYMGESGADAAGD